MSQSVAELLHAHADKVREYNGKTTGVKAGIARAIPKIELSLVLAGAMPGTADQVKDKDHVAQFVAWENPSESKSTRTPYSEDDARTDIANALRVMFENMPGLDQGFPESIRTAADNSITSALKKSTLREYAIPDPRSTVAEDASHAWTRTDAGEYVITARPDGKVWTRKDGVNGPARNLLAPIPPTKNAPVKK